MAMTEVSIDDALIKEAANLYPRRSPDEIAAEAIKSYLAYAELLKMKGILKDGDLWDNDDSGELERLQ
jgi:hypothetical protein